MTGDQAAAALSFATTLSEGMMPKSPQSPEMTQGASTEVPVEPSQTLESAPGEEMMPEQENMPVGDGHGATMAEIEKVIDEKFEELKNELLEDLKGEEDKTLGSTSRE